MNNSDFVVSGFRASAVAAGIKKDKTALDLALIVSDTDTVSAGVFTTNKVKAAPVILSMEHIKNNSTRAIIANAGNANACTGEEGLRNARQTVDKVAAELGVSPHEVLVASTGVIGAQLNMELIEKAVPKLVGTLSPRGIPDAAKAIMTTDSFPKLSRFEGRAGNDTYQVVGIAKGAGMMMPNMATMLCFILTDLRIDRHLLNKALMAAVEKSFNRITVDGDTSTNDSVLAMSSGAAGNGPLDDNDYAAFVRGLSRVTEDLAIMIVRDGEGATKVVFVNVRGAATLEDASIAARTVANSSLVKTAFYGQDPNWGRIMAALGRSGILMKETGVSIRIDDVKIVEMGLGLGADKEKEAARKMKNREFSLTIDLHQGDYEDRIITCDLTQEYVSINADYRT